MRTGAPLIQQPCQEVWIAPLVAIKTRCEDQQFLIDFSNNYNDDGQQDVVDSEFVALVSHRVNESERHVHEKLIAHRDE